MAKSSSRPSPEQVPYLEGLNSKAYPTRRACLEVVFFDAAEEEVFRWGEVDDEGYLADGAGRRQTSTPFGEHIVRRRGSEHAACATADL
ncbi:MAG: hypothetical protein ACJA1R_000366 [Flavobacteriales bacterium]|jgi:hypothetical protein